MKQITIYYVPSTGVPPVKLKAEQPTDKLGHAPHMYYEDKGGNSIRVLSAWRVWKNQDTFLIPINQLLNLAIED